MTTEITLKWHSHSEASKWPPGTNVLVLTETDETVWYEVYQFVREGEIASLDCSDGEWLFAKLPE